MQPYPSCVADDLQDQATQLTEEEAVRSKAKAEPELNDQEKSKPGNEEGISSQVRDVTSL